MWSMFKNYMSFVNIHYPCSKATLSPLLHVYVEYFRCDNAPLYDSRLHVPKNRKSSCKEYWLLLSNAQSNFYKLDELRALVRATNPTIVCITESWLTPDVDNDIVQISGFCSFRNDRRDNPNDFRKGGGVIVYLATHVHPVAVDIPSQFVRPCGIEFCLVAFHEPSLSFLLCIYIPPGILAQSFHDFQQYVIHVFDFLLTTSPEANLYLCGDLNQYDFSFLTQCFDLDNIVSFPTYRDNTLDKFFCHVKAVNDFNAVSAPPLGSATHLHNVVFISKNFTRACNNDLLYKVYDLRMSNLEAFQDVLSDTDWSSITSFTSVNDCSQFLYEKLYHAMAVIPVSFVKFKPKTKPWITPVVLDLINKRWKAYRCKNYVLYNHYKEKVKREIVKSKKIWSSKMCKSSKGFWSLVNNVRGKNTSKSVHHLVSLFSNASEAAEAINTRFSQFFCKSEPFSRVPTGEHGKDFFVCKES